ncbi:MAG: hypothetical protein LBG27_14340 [Spirochaetaceae bacterium]|jgi:hypothetical protein|nr:hypothetical protein [Spirochaetaceae bacterium]
MAHFKDWLPRTRESQLEMGQAWARQLGAKSEAWGMPVAVRTDLIALHRKATDTLDEVMEAGMT